MGIERRVDTDLWEEPWFLEVRMEGKLLYQYLWTAPRSSSCGAFAISPKQIHLGTGIPVEEIPELLESFGGRIQWWPDHQIVFVREFYRAQHPNPSFAANARKALAAFPAEVRDTVYRVYPDLCPDPGNLTSVSTQPVDTLPTPSTQPVDTLSRVLELDPEVDTDQDPDGEKATRVRARRAPTDGHSIDREPDPWFEQLSIGIYRRPWTELLDSERGQLQRPAKELKRANVDPDLIVRVCRFWESDPRWSDLTLRASGLLNNWTKLTNQMAEQQEATSAPHRRRTEEFAAEKARLLGMNSEPAVGVAAGARGSPQARTAPRLQSPDGPIAVPEVRR